MSSDFSLGSIVWVDLGYSFGRWPGEVVDGKWGKSESKDVMRTFAAKREARNTPLKEVTLRNNVIREENVPPVVENSEPGPSSKENKVAARICVRFFDDDKYDCCRVPPDRVESYSCPDKKDYIRQGLKKFSEVSKNKLVDNESTQNQLIKDVELAEVMTDNDPEVAAILSELVLLDTDPAMLEAEAKRKRNAKRRKGGGRKKRKTN